jgi:3-hydroxyisobutyrate dehydrogenase
MNIAFLGTGLMGAGFVRHLLETGHQVTVWNRSAEKARALEAAGARVAESAAAAVEGASRVHLSLSDDASVDSVLEPLAGVIGPDVWVVDHTTTAPTPTRARAARWAERHRRFAHAPVFMAPANCLAGTGIMLLSGPEATHQALEPHLKTMTGQLVYLGGAPERAAAFKLFGNLTLLVMLGALGDVNRLAHACGIPTAEAFALFSSFNPGAALPMRAAKIASGDTTASFELSMARKDLRLMIEEAEAGGISLKVAPAVAALLDEGIAAGLGAEDVTVAAQVR